MPRPDLDIAFEPIFASIAISSARPLATTLDDSASRACRIGLIVAIARRAIHFAASVHPLRRRAQEVYTIAI